MQLEWCGGRGFDNAFTKSCREARAAASTQGKAKAIQAGQKSIIGSSKTLFHFLIQTLARGAWKATAEPFSSGDAFGCRLHSKASGNKGAERRKQSAQATVFNLHQAEPQNPQCFYLTRATEFIHGERQNRLQLFHECKACLLVTFGAMCWRN